ncbi:MAG: molybdopterin-dependent oxidoreductase, partial [Deltaproteobacteria bacterium]|nr:molybdopterin-dependent oxidoreductase [Deltaproteobacteria bacterium]
PGVKAIITHKDTGGLMAGPDQFLLREDSVKYFGDEIAAVAAVDEDTACEAAELIKVEYEPMKPLLSVEEATAEGAPVIHDHCDDNYADDLSMNFGDAEKAFSESEHVRVDEYTVNPMHSCFTEQHIVLADYSLPDKLTIWTPIQVTAFIQMNMAFKFGIPEGNVRIMNLNSGGCFCGRGSEKAHHYIAAILSRKTGKPVKIRCTADEEFLVFRGGGKYSFKFRTGVMKNGALKAIEADLLLDCGAYMDVQFIVLSFIGHSLQMLYKVDATKFSGKLVYTNNHPYMFHHGTGMVALRFALGSQLDLIAKDLGIDPVEMRLINAVDKKYTTPSKIHYASCGLKECIKDVSKKSGWKKKHGKLPPYRGIGIGCGVINSGGKGMFIHDTSAAVVNVEENGKVSLFTGLPDMGQGSHTAMAMIAAETLGIKLEDIRVVAGDTDITPFDVGAIAQRGTFTTGNAVKKACLDAKKQIAKTAADKLGVQPSSLVFRDKKIYPKGAPDKAVQFEDVVYEALYSKEGRYIMGNGFYNPPTEHENPETHEGNSTLAYSFGAQVAEVEVDPETGIVKLLKMTVAHDVGRAINPLAVEGQLDGQVFSGMGKTMFEECIMENGQVLNPTLLDYKLPRSFEVPEIEHKIVETIDPYGPFGAKEVGQGPIQCTTQAIANAVSNAIGYPIKELPITPERVLQLIKQKKKEQEKNI